MGFEAADLGMLLPRKSGACGRLGHPSVTNRIGLDVSDDDDDDDDDMPPVTTNDDSIDKSSGPKERRFKLSRACDRCRRRRIKCDEGHPCQSCLTANSACTFEEPGKRTHPHKSKRATTLEDRMHHLESLIQAIPFTLFNPGAPALAAPTLAPDPSSPHASLASATHAYPLGVPPPSLSAYPLVGPSTHFPSASTARTPARPKQPCANQLVEETARLSLSPSYLYLDDEGYTRWQGETSGLPLLDLLVQRELPPTPKREKESSVREAWSRKSSNVTTGDWFPDREPRTTQINPETLWRRITCLIVPELMDSLVQCFLSTSHYLMPFLHVPTFLEDYGNPQKWGEPGFASFIVAICCLSSRHIDDPRVRADPTDGFSAGTQWFELFTKLRTLPTADRPTLYTVQSVFVAAVYAIGLGKLSKGFALLSEALTLSVDAGLHRSAEAYDCFGPVEDEVRKRTFWCVYMWDKQAGAAFGRPPMMRLRDCDVPEPELVDDEYITRDGVVPQPAGTESRMSAFVATLRLFVVLEAVLDVPPTYNAASPFLARAAGVLSGFQRHRELREEEALLDELVGALPAYWAHTAETMASEDVIRVTQAERLHCVEQFIRMLIQRHRFSELMAERTYGGGEGEQGEPEREAMMACHGCAIQLVHAHMQVATKGLMTYYGVHVIHQLTQAGRSLIAILLNCKTEDLQPLVPPSLDALRACVGLLRRFSGRYVCGLRSGELIEEFCRLTRIPLDAPMRTETPHSQARTPWIRPVRKKTPSGPRSTAGSSNDSAHDSPEDTSPAMTTMDNLFDMGPQSPSVYSAGPTSPDHTAPPFPLPLPLDAPAGTGRYALDDAGMGVGEMHDEGGMASSALFSLLHEGNFDMNALFHNDAALFVGQQQQQPAPAPGRGRGGGSYVNGYLHQRGHGETGVGMMGMVSTP